MDALLLLLSIEKYCNKNQQAHLQMAVRPRCSIVNLVLTQHNDSNNTYSSRDISHDGWGWLCVLWPGGVQSDLWYTFRQCYHPTISSTHSNRGPPMVSLVTIPSRVVVDRRLHLHGPRPCNGCPARSKAGSMFLTHEKIFPCYLVTLTLWPIPSRKSNPSDVITTIKLDISITLNQL